MGHTVGGGCQLVAVLLWALLAPSSCTGDALLPDTDDSRTSITQCYAPERPGKEHIVSCTVTYTSDVTLLCPDLSIVAAQWRKLDNTHSTYVCTGPECNLNPSRELSNDDTGVYLCQVPLRNGSDVQDHYIQLTVLAPPSLKYVDGCGIVKERECDTADVSAYIDDQYVWITVAFSGVGPFHVQWYHNGTAYNCTDYQPHCEETTHYNHTTGVHRNTMRLDFVGRFDQYRDPGIYEANVSNAYGWNVSHTELTFQCPVPYPPHSDIQFTSQTLTEGQTGSLSCRIGVGYGLYLGACYAKMGESLEDLNKTERCIVCNVWTTGVCGYPGYPPTIPYKPDWSISIERLNDCHSTVVTNIHIDRVSKEDKGQLICTWDIDRYNYGNNYTTVTVTVDQEEHHRLSTKEGVLYIAVPVVVAVLTAAFVAAVVVAVRGRRRRRRLGKRRRRTRARYGTISLPGDTSSDDEQTPARGTVSSSEPHPPSGFTLQSGSGDESPRPI